MIFILLLLLVFLWGYNFYLISKKEISSMLKAIAIIMNVVSLFAAIPLVFIASILGVNGDGEINFVIPLIMGSLLILPQFIFTFIILKKKSLNDREKLKKNVGMEGSKENEEPNDLKRFRITILISLIVVLISAIVRIIERYHAVHMSRTTDVMILCLLAAVEIVIFTVLLKLYDPKKLKVATLFTTIIALLVSCAIQILPTDEIDRLNQKWNQDEAQVYIDKATSILNSYSADRLKVVTAAVKPTYDDSSKNELLDVRLQYQCMTCADSESISTFAVQFNIDSQQFTSVTEDSHYQTLERNKPFLNDTEKELSMTPYYDEYNRSINFEATIKEYNIKDYEGIAQGIVEMIEMGYDRTHNNYYEYNSGDFNRMKWSNEFPDKVLTLKELAAKGQVEQIIEPLISNKNLGGTLFSNAAIIDNEIYPFGKDFTIASIEIKDDIVRLKGKAFTLTDNRQLFRLQKSNQEYLGVLTSNNALRFNKAKIQILESQPGYEFKVGDIVIVDNFNGSIYKENRQ
ncbi:hypothetical protein [Ureibacillus aquaedulcis]|uniref:Uncharacterized protein n=1 Tax=Ureibacillus aquaedulcis TaxID=3058421 RepID=A0ABT8GMZ2_9BACL|nr:hypothetical protein [Ureibacillus sp. BA0131]MDN4492614.1 hypothetical protein [Ureibacillus sp. BA0131]